MKPSIKMLRMSCLCPTFSEWNQSELLGFRSEILEHSTTQIVGNLTNLSDRIPIGKVNSDWTTRNYFRPVSDWNQVVLTGDAHELHLPSENVYLAHRHTLRLSLFTCARTIAVHARTLYHALSHYRSSTTLSHTSHRHL